MMEKTPVETYSDTETEARREAALRTMFATPHKPHEKLKRGSPTQSRKPRT